MTDSLIEVSDLCKFYGSVRALDRVSFDVREGQIVGFLGPNGAGKSTTLRILSGFMPGDSGVVRVAGYDVRKDSLAVRRQVGYLPEGVPVYPDMRVTEYLKFRSRLKGVPFAERGRQISKCLEQTGITDVRKRIIGTLSRGFRQRVGLADALLGEPRVLILDEPTVGLDPEQVRQFRSVLREVGRDRTVILSTHILGEVEIVCSDVVIIRQGQIVARDRAEALMNRVGERDCVIAEIGGPADRVAKALKDIDGVTRVAHEHTDDRAGEFFCYRVFASDEREATAGSPRDLREAVFATVKNQNWTLRRLEQGNVSLEDVFLDIVGGEGERLVEAG